MDLKLGNKSMVSQNEPPAIYLTPLKDMESGDSVSMTSGNGDSNCHTASENVGRHVQVSGDTPPRRVTSGKRKFDEVCSFESCYPSQKKRVSADKLACMVKESTSLVLLDEQLSPCYMLQSVSGQSSQSFKEVNCDVLKDRTNTLGDLTNKCQRKAQDLSICSEDMYHTDCITGSCLGPAIHCLEESRAVLMQEHKITEFTQEVCNGDLEHTETPRCACCDANDRCDAGFCAFATECRDIEGVDVNNGASCTDSSNCDRSCTQAEGHSDSLSELSQEVCNSDMEHTESPRCACCDTGYCTFATECRDIEGVDISNGASCTDSSNCDRSCTQAEGHSDSLSVHVESTGEQSETDTKTQSRRLYNVLLPPVYPRPLNCTHILTRRQFQNHFKSTESKDCLDVNDILSLSDDFLGPELRTRLMTAKIYNLKKFLQDMMSYPTVVLCRIDNKIWEKPLDN
jgi:hypothetical protein